VKAIRTDCDGDVLLLSIEQVAALPVIPVGKAVSSMN
jgi:hypothetical protein